MYDIRENVQDLHTAKFTVSARYILYIYNIYYIHITYNAIRSTLYHATNATNLIFIDTNIV